MWRDRGTPSFYQWGTEAHSGHTVGSRAQYRRLHPGCPAPLFSAYLASIAENPQGARDCHPLLVEPGKKDGALVGAWLGPPPHPPTAYSAH